MAQKRYTPEQSIKMIHDVEIMLNKGSTFIEISRKLGITEQTYYRMQKKYSGMRVVQAERLRELKQENAHLKKLVAELSYENVILKEANRKNFEARQKRARK